MPALTAKFDYRALARPLATFVKKRTVAIRKHQRRAVRDIVAIGKLLLQVKAKLPHGHFGVWLDTEFDWTWRTADKFMLVAERFPKLERGSNFAPSALYLLANASTPQEAIEEAVVEAASGQTITEKRAQEIIDGKRKPAEVIAEMTPEEQLELQRLTQQHYAQKAEAEEAETPTPEDEDAQHLKLARSHFALGRKHLEEAKPDNRQAITLLDRTVQAIRDV